MSATTETIETISALGERYKYGWTSDIEMDFAPKGLNEDIVRLISARKEEPEWLTEWRLKAFPPPPGTPGMGARGVAPSQYVRRTLGTCG